MTIHLEILILLKMSTKKLGFFYLPILAILVTVAAIILDLIYNKPLNLTAVGLLTVMAIILFIGIKTKAYRG